MHSFPRFNLVKPARYGTMIYNHFDEYVGKSIELYGEFSEAECAVFGQLLQPGQIALDIGANIGAHTLVMARLVGPGGSVIAFEPQRIVFQTLCGNMAINSVTNVRCHWAAVSDRAGTIKVPQPNYNAVGNFGGVALGHHTRGEEVPVVTIDSLNLTACAFMKIDVEGMAISVIKGAAETMQRHQPILYVENDRKDQSEALISHISGLGYRLYWHKPRLFSALNFEKNPINIFGDLVSVNMLCLPGQMTAPAGSDLEPVALQGGQQPVPSGHRG